MKKLNTLIIILLISICNTKAQIISERAYMLCNYSCKSVSDTSRRDSTTKEVASLEIGKSGSYYYSINHKNHEKAMLDFKNNHAGERLKPGESLKMILAMGTPMKVYKNHKESSIVYFDKIALSYYTFEEEMPTFDWIIQPDTMTVLNQICQKATCYFRGRSYEAWFSQAIAVSEGPWKFNGLPGLILKIKDSRNDYVFDAIEIKKIDYDIPTETPIAQKVSKEKFLSIYKYFLTDPMMGVDIKKINPNIKLSNTALPWNPLELTDK